MLYCFLWLYNIFPHFLIKVTIFEKMLLNIKRVFWFSLQFLCETFVILRGSQWDIIINIQRTSCKVPVILVWLWLSLNFFSINFRKSSNFKIHENSFIGSRDVPDVRRLVVAFRNFVNAPKNSTFSRRSVFMCSVWIWEKKQRLFPYTALTDWFL